jgi:hypothetical protein
MRPVFIGGCDRSGTTLLAAMLGNHSACLTTPESQFKTNILPVLEGSLDRIRTERVVTRIGKHWRFRLWGMELPGSYGGELGERAPYGEILAWMARQYGREVEKPDARWWIDHTPVNLRYAARLAEIFPEARFLHIVRDGRAVAASVIPLDWGPNTIVHAAPWWGERVSHGLAAETLPGPARALRVTYEELVREPERVMRGVCDFCAIPYEPAVLVSAGFRVPKYTENQHALIGGTPDPSRIDAWRSKLTRREIEIFEASTGDLLPLLGYPLEFGNRARRATGKETRRANWVEWIRPRLRRGRMKAEG